MWLTARQIAEMTGLREDGVRKLVQRKWIPHYKFGASLRFDRAEIGAWIEEGHGSIPSQVPGGEG
ncbi:helix-turn-helix domain-containing protein [Frankia tisae]|uniref:helix-turn-helix domain-containing protein n=1 Tax=Frankia tisae TaxID=2950104 RepID=UPI003557AD56